MSVFAKYSETHKIRFDQIVCFESIRLRISTNKVFRRLFYIAFNSLFPPQFDFLDVPDPPEKKKKKDLFALHNKTVEKTWQKRSQQIAASSTMPEELSLYLGRPKIYTNCNNFPVL